MGVLLSAFLAGMWGTTAAAGSAAAVAGSAASIAGTIGAVAAVGGIAGGLAAGATSIAGAASGGGGDSGGGGGPAITDTGSVTPATTESVEAQAAQRRLARLSKYFTSPTGIMQDPNSGTTGVF